MYKDQVDQSYQNQPYQQVNPYNQPYNYQANSNLSPAPQQHDVTMYSSIDHSHSPLPFLHSPLPFHTNFAQSNQASSHLYHQSSYQSRAESPQHFLAPIPHDLSQPNHMGFQSQPVTTTQPHVPRSRTDPSRLANLANLRKQIINTPPAFQEFRYEPPAQPQSAHMKTISASSRATDLEQVMSSNQPDSLIYRPEPRSMAAKHSMERPADAMAPFSYQHARVEDSKEHSHMSDDRHRSISRPSSMSGVPSKYRFAGFEKPKIEQASTPKAIPRSVPMSQQVGSPLLRPASLPAPDSMSTPSSPTITPRAIPSVSPIVRPLSVQPQLSPVVRSLSVQPPLSPALTPSAPSPTAADPTSTDLTLSNPKKRKISTMPRGSKRAATSNNPSGTARDGTRVMFAPLLLPDSPMFDAMLATLQHLLVKDAADNNRCSEYHTGVVYVLLHIMAYADSTVMQELLSRAGYTAVAVPEVATTKKKKLIETVPTRLFRPPLQSWPQLSLPGPAALSWTRSPNHAPADEDTSEPQFAQMIWYRPYSILFYRLPGNNRVLCCDPSTETMPSDAILVPVNQVDLALARPPLIVVVNRAFERLFGFSQSEVKGMYCREGRSSMSRFMDLDQYKAISVEGSRKIFAGDSDSSHFVTITTAHNQRITALVLHRIKFDQQGFVLKRTWIWVKLPSTRTAANSTSTNAVSA